MKRIILPFLLLLFWANYLKAQIINGADTLYGNEWIKYDQSYFKILVAEDGVYRISWQALSDAGVPVGQIEGDRYRLFHNGEEVPLYLSAEGLPGADDFLEFYGKKNASEFDRYLFKDPDKEMMNPLYSLFTDTSAYFLTWSEGSGKRYQFIENALVNLPPKDDFYQGEYVLSYINSFSKKANAQNISTSDYGATEGWATAAINTQTIKITLPNVSNIGSNGQLYVRYCTNVGAHRQEISLNGEVLATEEFTGVQLREVNFDIPNQTLQSQMSLKFLGLEASADRQRISNVIVRYPALFNFDNKPYFTFEIAASQTVRYLEISNFKTSDGIPALYDLTNQTRMLGVVENGVVKLALPPSAQPRRLALVNDQTGVKMATVLQPVQFTDYSTLNAEFILLSNSRLYDDGNGVNYVQEYADYRSSAAGGGYSTVVVDVQQLYDQFGWGIHRHPLSIRSFAHFVKKNWPDVQYFFILGKGREYNGIRSAAQVAAATSFYVPTFGYPGADNLLMSTNKTAAPIIPFGRLAVSSPDDIAFFLKKLKDMDASLQAGQSIEERQWLKNIIHLGGGGNASEQQLIKGYLAAMGNIVGNNLFGATVYSFFKTSSDPVQTSKMEQIFEKINNGVSIITFFGHSAVGVFDFNFDNPDHYKNFGRYPVIFSLGCYSGNIHTNGLGIAERFVFQRDKAAIGMVSTTGQGYISSLNSVMSRFYTWLGSEEYYGQSMGVLMQKTIEYFEASGSTQLELLQQTTYLGDPAFKIHAAEGPDYLIDASSVKVLPKHINIRQDSFELRFAVVNIGKGVKDSISLRIEQELPNGERIGAAMVSIQAPTNKSEVSLKLSTVGKPAVGRNRLYIAADAEDEVVEYPLPAAEMNNELVDANGQKGFSFFITDSGAKPVYPANFAIVGDAQPVLKASTSDALAPLAGYVFEIDTTARFNSPMKRRIAIEQSGGLLEWRPALPFENEKVYYWRVSPDSLNQEEGYAWESRSFTYIAGSPDGWSQRHYWQFLEDRLEDMRLDEGSRKFRFPQDFADFRIRNKVYNASDPPDGFINGFRLSDFFRWNINASLTVVVFDTLGRKWVNDQPGQYGSVNTNAARIVAFPFPVATAEQREKIIQFMEDIVPDNHWVVVYTAQRTLAENLKITEWEADSLVLGGKNIFNVLEAQGAQQVRSLKDNLTPYYFAYRKNMGAILEAKAGDPLGEINPEISISGTWWEGRVGSVEIGPAKSWKSFQWSYDSEGMIDQDSFYVDIYGLSTNQEEAPQLLFEKVKGSELDLSAISKDSFPSLRLEFYAKDSTDRSPVQLKAWTVFYEGLPDAAFEPNKHFLFYRDTLQEGEALRLESRVSATNPYPMDSLLVRYEIRDLSGNIARTEERVGKLSPDAGLDLSFSKSTKGLRGAQQLLVQLNPGEDQPELHSSNNFLVKDFYVERDRRNPLLDVTFDGVHILNGDIVSPRPLVHISLEDENPFLLLEDTSSFKLFLMLPNGDLQNIPLHSPELSFQPAVSGADNRSTIEWRPAFAEGGEYALIVQAGDASGNSAGEYDYKVGFKVVLETMISNVLAYPNPFSTATRFVYTLTGETPDFFKIQIMTISGRIVREITQDEIGPLRIGTHQTDFVWDGTDEFGDRLANGVYVYRVLTRDSENQEYKRYETSADKFFKGGFGKLTIIR